MFDSALNTPLCMYHCFLISQEFATSSKSTKFKLYFSTEVFHMYLKCQLIVSGDTKQVDFIWTRNLFTIIGQLLLSTPGNINRNLAVLAFRDVAVKCSIKTLSQILESLLNYVPWMLSCPTHLIPYPASRA